MYGISAAWEKRVFIGIDYKRPNAGFGIGKTCIEEVVSVEKKYSKLKGAMAVLAAGTALVIGTIRQEGIKVRTYPALAEMGYCTLMVYMNGSDLDKDNGCAAVDLEEMTKALNKIDDGEKIHIVVEAGGAIQWQYEPMKDILYGRFCITKNMDKVEVQELKARNMGRPDTLADFLNYGIGSYPAEHYGLICWNHGEGQIQGFGCDLNFNEDSLTLDEIRDAFEKSVVNDPLDFVAMDACLMGNVELAAVLEGKAEYLIASEDLEPQEGYDYCWVEVLNADDTSEAYGKQIGEAIITAYQQFFEKMDYSVTLSLVDINAFHRFHEVFDELIDAVNNCLITAEDEELLFQKLGKQRTQMLGFNQQNESNVPEQVDLMDFIWILENLCEELCPQTDFIMNGKEEIEKAYEQFVIRTSSQGYSKLPCGLSIFLPGSKGKETVKAVAAYQKIRFCDGYSRFAKKYADYLNKDYRYTWNVPEMQGGKVVLPLGDDQMEHIANAYAVVSYAGKDGYSFFIFADGDAKLDLDGYLKADKEIVFWGIKGKVLSLIEVFDSKGLTEYISPILYREAGDGEWKYCMMYIEFSEKRDKDMIREIRPVDVEKQIYTLKEGDQLIPLYPLSLEDEEEETIYSDPRIYDNNYYMGQKVVIENQSAGDDQLETISCIDIDKLAYGFLIRDDRMNLYCSDMVKPNKNEKYKEEETWEKQDLN